MQVAAKSQQFNFITYVDNGNRLFYNILYNRSAQLSILFCFVLLPSFELVRATRLILVAIWGDLGFKRIDFEWALIDLNLKAIDLGLEMIDLGLKVIDLFSILIDLKLKLIYIALILKIL